MSFQIIIKGRAKYGKTRAEIGENLRKDGISDHGLFRSREDRDRAEWIDKKEGLRNLDSNQLHNIRRKTGR
jgi:hypothetical protein